METGLFAESRMIEVEGEEVSTVLVFETHDGSIGIEGQRTLPDNVISRNALRFRREAILALHEMLGNLIAGNVNSTKEKS